MEPNNGLAKLIPKAISSKRRRRKMEKAQADARPLSQSNESTPRSLSLSNRELSTESDETASSRMADDNDDRSFGSFESNGPPVPEKDRVESPSARPSVSSHPSLIGYLTTASPEVHASYVDPDSHPISPPPSQDLAQLSQPILEPPAAARVASDRRNKKAPRIETATRPETPPSGGGPAPVIVNTPPTPTDDIRPVASIPEGRASFHALTSTPDSGHSPPSGNTNAHRRTRSASSTLGPSKLSSVTPAPLTPTPESGEITPSNPPGSGFFSSMFSAAQTAATNFNIQGTGIGAFGGNKSRTGLPKTSASHSPAPSTVEVEPAAAAQVDGNMDQKEAAVRTLGSGDLSLSQLGIPEPSSTSPSRSSKFPDLTEPRSRAESAPADSQTADFLVDEPSSRPRTPNESISERHSPPGGDTGEPLKGGVHRSSSIRSVIKPHRKRGSSVTTTSAIGAAIAAANNSLSSPQTNYSAPKLTGFAIASKKRNRDFHTLFKSVPDDDYLIEDYSCALQREILAQGRLYVSEGHLCFNSNILGWVSTVVLSFDEIVSVEKKSTALLFKNGLLISTLHAKYSFASFTSRDATYDLIVNIWKLGHPTLKSTLNGVHLEGTGGDKTEKVGGSVGEPETQNSSDTEDSDESDEEEFYDEEEGNGEQGAQTTLDAELDKGTSRRVSGATPAAGMAEAMKDSTGPGSTDFPGPVSHAPTECGDTPNHYDRVMGDDIIPAPLGKAFEIMFGQPSVAWMSKWLVNDQKCMDLVMEDKKGLSLENKTRTYTYIKPLSGAIGPSKTKCIVSETLEGLDFENSISLTSSTQTPDVPSGNVFATRTRYCLSWAENNSTRVLVTCSVEWTGKSWLKGPIEKGCFDGQSQHMKDLFVALKAALSTRSRTGTGTNGAPKSGPRKRGKKNKTLQSGTATKETKPSAKEANWGLLEPLHGILSPMIDIIQPIFTGNIMYGLLVGLLVATWFGFGITPRQSGGGDGPLPGTYHPDRVAAYEEMWRRQDSELWTWLEERVGMDRMQADSPIRRRAVEPRTVEERLREERMDAREVEHAIQVTEEKLKVLRDVVGKTGPAESLKGGSSE